MLTCVIVCHTHIYYILRLAMKVIFLRTLRNPLRPLRLNFYRKVRRDLRKGRKEKYQVIAGLRYIISVRRQVQDSASRRPPGGRSAIPTGTPTGWLERQNKAFRRISAAM